MTRLTEWDPLSDLIQFRRGSVRHRPTWQEFQRGLATGTAAQLLEPFPCAVQELSAKSTSTNELRKKC